MTRARQVALCDADAARQFAPWSTALLAFSFRQGPTFRMGFDAHVKAWGAHNSTRVLAEYLNNPRFAEAHDAEVARRRAVPMPAWGALKESRHG